MKEQILEKLSSVQNALDNIEVKHRQNVALMTGVMGILDEVRYLIENSNFVEAEQQRDEG